jgi:hypothetical protein
VAERPAQRAWPELLRQSKKAERQTQRAAQPPQSSLPFAQRQAAVQLDEAVPQQRAVPPQEALPA